MNIFGNFMRQIRNGPIFRAKEAKRQLLEEDNEGAGSHSTSSQTGQVLAGSMLNSRSAS